MKSVLRPAVITFALLACSDAIGLKPPSAKSDLVEVVTTVSKTELGVGDTATFAYYVKNIMGANLTLTTDAGCQMLPDLDQVAGPQMVDLLNVTCPSVQTVRVLAPGEKVQAAIILRGFDKNKPLDQQTPGYVLTEGTFDASMLVTAKELPLPVRSDWVRFKVKE